MNAQAYRCVIGIVAAVVIFSAQAVVTASQVSAQNVQSAARAQGLQHEWYRNASKSIRALMRQRKYNQAIKQNRQLGKRVADEFGARSFDAAITLSTEGHILTSLGRHQEALQAYSEGLDVMEERFGPVHSQVVISMINVASAAGRLKQTKQAKALYEKALGRAIRLSGNDGLDYLGVLRSYAAFNANFADTQIAELQLAVVTTLTRTLKGATSTALLAAYQQQAALLAKQQRFADLDRFRLDLTQRTDDEHGKVSTFAIQLVANFAKLYKRAGKDRTAEALYGEVIDRSEKRFGPQHRFTVANYVLLADTLHEHGRYQAALEFYEKALAGWQEAFKKDDRNLHGLYLRYGLSLRKRGRFKEAETALRNAEATSKKAFGKYHRYNADPYLYLAGLYKEMGRLEESEKLYRQALAIARARYRQPHSSIALTLDNLAVLYIAMGRYDDAENYAKQSLDMFERVSGTNSVSMIYVLNNLSNIYGATNRSNEALRYLTRALAITEKNENFRDHPVVGVLLDNLAATFAHRGKLKKALSYRNEAHARLLRIHGKKNASVARATFNLGALHIDLGDHKKALEWYQRSLAIVTEIYGEQHQSYASGLGGIARALAGLKRTREALDHHRRALKILNAVLPDDHPSLVLSHLNVANLLWHQKRPDAALRAYQQAATIALNGSSNGRMTRDGASAFRGIIRAAFAISPTASTNAQLFNLSFNAAQRLGDASVASALAKMSARFAAGKDSLGTVVRAQQDLATLLKTKNAQLTTALGATSTKRDQKLIDQLRASVSGLKKKLDDIETELRRNFPRYAELSLPQPVKLEAMRQQLRANELYVQFSVIGDDLFVWVVDKQHRAWHRLDLKRSDLRRLAATLRCGLDTLGWHGNAPGVSCYDHMPIEPTSAIELPFDLHAAHELYQALFGRIEHRLKGRHLLIVVQDALATLPLHVLVRKRTNSAFVARSREYREVAWLAKSNAITILPAASSLLAIRRYAGASRAPEPFFGLGDPVLAGTAACPTIAVPEKCIEPAPVYASYKVADTTGTLLRSGGTDVSAVSQLCPLPDTAHELRCVAKSLNAGPDRILLQEAANETALKALSKNGKLRQHRILHFATHGLLASEAQMLKHERAEPALVLTPPTTATPENDGLLTASEVAQLKLNADWVILSACNTASSGGPSGEALSGLARAFFYAGARAALVSHWPVVSSAAVKLTTNALAMLQKVPELGRAEAMRRSMISIIARGKEWEAHPNYWAPFVVVGEGSALVQSVVPSKDLR